MSSDFDVPVAILAFNRPAPTARLMSAISEVRPSRLFVIADGPRENVPGDEDRCRETRDIIESFIRWPAEVTRNFADVNLNCRRRPETGLDWLFAQVDRAIILEDDCIPHPAFFPYCEQLLERYANSPRVGAVAGTSPIPGTGSAVPAPAEENYVLSRYPLSWGWATWSRAWRLNDPALSAWPRLKASSWLPDMLGSRLAVAYWKALFDAGYNGFDAWDYGWTFSCWCHDLLTVHPAANLVSNIGFDASATHTRQPSKFTAMPTRPVGTPLVGPSTIERNVAYDEQLEKLIFSGDWETLFARIQSRLAGTSR